MANCGMGMSADEINVVKAQAAQRAKMREMFLKQRTNPYKHAAEAGYVFDENMQRYLSMKVSQYERFQTSPKNSIFGMCAIVLPMVAYGTFVWNGREKVERQIRSGELKYKDRGFKFQ